MITISPIKTYNHNFIKKENKISKQPQNKNFTTFSPIYFLGDIKTVPQSRLTQDKIDAIYKNYKNSLREISLEQIENTVDELQFSTEFSRKEILEAMQQVTQFGNMKSLIKIGEALNKNGIGGITTSKEYIKNTFGVNDTLFYLIDCKNLYSLNESNRSVAVFLDNNVLSQLENLKKTDPELFKKFKKIYKFFIVTGLENGISFLNREKNLKEETKNLLFKRKEKNSFFNKKSFNEILNEDYLKRAKALGIKPIIIKNENNPTENNIYEQLRPEQISKKTLNNIIDATVKFKTRIHQEQIDNKAFITDYLYRNLNVITPESLSKYLKITHDKIKQIVEAQNKKMEDVIYIIPKSGKSFDLINYQYKLVNDIPDSKFINTDNKYSLTQFDFDNKVLVILDDCSLSGDTLINDTESIRKTPKINSNIIYAPIIISSNAEFEIKKTIKRSNSAENFLVINKKINTKEYDKKYDNILGLSDAYESYCLILPYMCPDNNTSIAATLGYFHSLSQYIPYSDNIYDNIKTFTSENEKVINKMEKDKNL